MRKDYSITIFSRHKGKTFSFHLDRRVIYVPMVILIVLVVSCVLLGQFYFQEREERQRLEGRVALLEQLMDKFEARVEREGGEVLSKGVAKPAAQPTVEVALVPKEEEKKPEPAAKAEPKKEEPKAAKDIDDDDDWGAVPAFLRRSKLK